MYAIPAIAAYDSWNPISEMACGNNAICIVSDARRILPVSLNLPLIMAVSLMKIKMSALVSDAPAPVMSV